MRRFTVVVVSVLVCVFGGRAVVRGQDAPVSLNEAAASGNVEQIKQYIAKKANLNVVDAYGYSPLKRAVEASQLEAAKVLLEGGANPNVKDTNGMTPLHLACIGGQKDIAEALLAAKADHAAKDGTGRSPLHCAVQMGQIELVDLLIRAGADVNATDIGGQTPLAAARQRNIPEIEDMLVKHGGIMPAVRNDPYGDLGAAQQTTEVVGNASQRPADFVIDANVIREDLKKFAALEAPLKAIDANSQTTEQRAWVLRRSDTRTTLLRAVQKQFEDEMAFVKKLAVEEKAAKTTKAIDDLVAARKSRYASIGEQLRDQRRQALQEGRNSMTNTGPGMGTGTRGRGTTGRGGTRGRSSDATAGGYTGTGSQGAYATTPQARTPRRSAAAAATEVNEPPVTADTQAQIQAWLNSTPENKAELLSATHELDVVEYAVLHASATEEKAVKTGVSIMALLMLREERIAKINQKWLDEDERMQKMQERMGPNGMQGGTQQGMQQGTQQQGMRRGRR